MQELPHWGVMFSDGSVCSRWNGHTQQQRATEYVEKYTSMYAGYPVTLAYRKDSRSPWVRVTPTPSTINER